MPGFCDPNLRARGAAISRRTDWPHAQPMLSWQIVSIRRDHSFAIQAAGVADHIEIAIAINVSKAQAVVH
jgi:hypothetical protein